ncbi:hypothetical protein PBAL39_22775 [Pedobacter sp. BAL39]|nr:hypothetical protein PBAL39_22775 [Pedobacter sp. BAL39]
MACSLLSSITKAQQKLPVTDKSGEPINYGVSHLRSKTPLTLTPDQHTKSISPFNATPNDPLGTIVYLENATSVKITTDVRKDSLSYYRYSVFENDTTVLKSDARLSQVDFIWPDNSDFPGYLTMNLGISDVRNKKITIKIYRLPEESKVTTLIIFNKPLQTAQIKSVNLISKGRTLRYHVPDLNINIPIIRELNDVKPLKNGLKVHVNQKTRGIQLTMGKTDLDVVYHAILKKKSGGKNQIVFLSNNWTYQGNNDDLFNFIPASYFSDPGTYELIVSPVFSQSSNQSTAYSRKAILSFTVVSPPATLGISEIAIGLTIISLLGGIAFLLIRRSSRKKLAFANRKAELAHTQLEQVRSQLSPHFVFNALAGIQNLMNRNEIENANSYLSKFARLTRNILNGQQQIALKDEHKLLEDYLAMEKLRFNFNYGIQLNVEIDHMEVMIPSMLLQPFLENAIKHSMAIMGDQGTLQIEFKSVQHNLILSVSDNGKGFDVQKNHDGLGLSLCEKRIDLLNEVYQECPIYLEINSGTKGTTVTITLTNWL